MFGDLESPCGPAIDGIAPVVTADENGGSADAIQVATPSDKGNSFVPGLNGELYDAGIAFEGWCNAQGGIAGMPLKVIDADAKLLRFQCKWKTFAQMHSLWSAAVGRWTIKNSRVSTSAE